MPAGLCKQDFHSKEGTLSFSPLSLPFLSFFPILFDVCAHILAIACKGQRTTSGVALSLPPRLSQDLSLICLFICLASWPGSFWGLPRLCLTLTDSALALHLLPPGTRAPFPTPGKLYTQPSISCRLSSFFFLFLSFFFFFKCC